MHTTLTLRRRSPHLKPNITRNTPLSVNSRKSRTPKS